MNTYVVKYLEGTDLRTAYVQGVNQSEAGKIFAKSYPNVGKEKILSVVNINEQTNDYGTSIAVASFVAFIGWLAIVIGAIIVIMALAPILKSGEIGLEILAVAPSLSVFIVGLVLVVLGQTSRAVLDNANYSKQMLDEMRNGK